MNAFERDLAVRFGDARIGANVSLASYTTLRIGGPADWFVTLRSANEVVDAIAIARLHQVPVTVIGGGSNLLVADAGVRGLVIRVHGGDVIAVDESTIRADAGVTINGLVRWTINRGVSGLEAWAGTPGTVGGAIHGNAHFQGRLIADIVKSVTLVEPGGTISNVPADAMEFAYDYSRLHRTREIVVAVEFRSGSGNPHELRDVARSSLAFRKRTQPLEAASAGCMFQNPDPSVDAVPADIPASAGALVDRAGLKGARVGSARVSMTHGNFIVNEGAATAEDVASLVGRCKREVWQRFGVRLREEVVRLGF